MPITVLNNQSLEDVAIRHCGTIEALFDIAYLNNISVTEELFADQILMIPSKDYGSQEVINYLQENKQEPASGFNNANSIIPHLGIGTMVIGQTFIIG